MDCQGYVRSVMVDFGRPVSVKEIAARGYRGEDAIRRALWRMWGRGDVQFTRHDMRKPCLWRLI
jgi:hypothetical protein